MSTRDGLRLWWMATRALSGLPKRRGGDHRYVARARVCKKERQQRSPVREREQTFEKNQSQGDLPPEIFIELKQVKTTQSEPAALSASLIYSAVPHLMTRSTEQERNICMP